MPIVLHRCNCNIPKGFNVLFIKLFDILQNGNIYFHEVHEWFHKDASLRIHAIHWQVVLRVFHASPFKPNSLFTLKNMLQQQCFYSKH
jgi:hypothetical protein